ncbi:hypothetical protein FSP39_025172 [Pinctada imbricata]|uniref:L-serine ammonia-lyase n=1 Tax=Pinctada imbricata TaxID=66713 RepID=A0AA88YFD6_PINIB|nr:hypothetical protein FSP39_025172 [Pinctada imbricata]
MWFAMEQAQNVYELSDRLIKAISGWPPYPSPEDDIEDLINLGADVNRLHGTFLPLHCACMVSDAECIELLLEKGARVNDRDGYGRAAIHYAAERDPLCLELLLAHGADINAGDGNRDTALHWASFKNNIPCVKLLLQHGAIVDVKDFNNDTPLGWAARKGNLGVIKLLLNFVGHITIEITVAMPSEDGLITMEEIKAAQSVLSQSPLKVHRTPLMKQVTPIYPQIDPSVDLYLKLENMQTTGSFKIRGVANQMSNLPKEVMSGNRKLGFGISVTQALTSELKNVVDSLVEKEGHIYFHSFDDLALIAGYGSCALEVLDECSDPDIVLVCCGGGGLVSGIAAGIKLSGKDACRVYAVEPEGSRTMYESFKEGEPVSMSVKSVAAGLSPPFAGTLTYKHCRKFVEEVLLVSDTELIETMRTFYNTGLVVEPSGCAAMTALLYGKVPDVKNKKVVVVVTGGNVTIEEMSQMLH